MKDELEFISSMTETLIWPLIVVWSLYYFREKIRFLLDQIKTVKIGSLEAEFQDLSISSQSLLFLDGIARKNQWTFYEERRDDERNLGPAFLSIAKDLLTVERGELIKKLHQWLSSKDENLIWFASEIIGYFRITEMENALHILLPEERVGKLKKHQLNCIWAHSRLTTMESLANFLMKTNSEENQVWTLFVFKQMPNDDANLSYDKRKEIIKKFMSRVDISGKARDDAAKIMSKIN
ncbi:hypothetical protein MNBD_NITROSPIRAE01-1753 [hydrothermal vent metagenome]|uniref:DNA alkylation repair enzyme n=1 Tax=hydrothermal vent metagenome TaxID=652676 RepID=A0A3B1DKY1_9ZZZZ